MSSHSSVFFGDYKVIAGYIDERFADVTARTAMNVGVGTALTC